MPTEPRVCASFRSLATRSVGVFALLAAGSACDKDPPAKPETAAESATVAPTPPPVASAPSEPVKPQLAVDDAAAYVSGVRVEMATPDAKGRLLGALEGKAVEGESLVLNAARDAKLPKVTAVFAAAREKKAAGLDVHTPRRDRTEAEVAFTFSAKPGGCAVVAYLAKDGAISVWPASGARAERFARGMAGPDLTRGSEGIRKRLGTCDVPAWFVAADDSVSWGLVIDLVNAVTGNEDGGAPLASPRAVALLTKTPVPGRKIEGD